MGDIFVVMTMTTLEEEKSLPYFGSERMVGWFSNFEDAFKYVDSNMGDIFETCYHYALIEQVPEGLYPFNQNRWWFEYNIDTDTYFSIEEPKFCKHYTGFTIG